MLQPFDFRVEGVTSISVDTHKVGWTYYLTMTVQISPIKFCSSATPRRDRAW